MDRAGSQENGGNVSKRFVRSLFALVIGLYLMQLAFVSRLTQPYPALMMPSFRGTGLDEEGGFRNRTASIVVTFNNGETETLTPGELFAGASSAYHGALMKWFAVPEAEERRADRETGMRKLLRQVLPGMAVRGRSQALGGSSPAMAAWLRQRLEAMYPGREPQQVRFVWYNERITFSGGRSDRVKIEDGVVTVELSHEHH
jgi:hypothetical protein